MESRKENFRVRGTILPIEILKMKGLNLDVYESKGIVKFKNGCEMDNVVKCGSFGYRVSEDGLYAFLVMIEDNDEVLEYIPIDLSEQYMEMQKRDKIRELRKKKI